MDFALQDSYVLMAGIKRLDWRRGEAGRKGVDKIYLIQLLSR